ncbi:hypothetical protein T484DRAFT_1892776, partial [Baffinella frigidus]
MDVLRAALCVTTRYKEPPARRDSTSVQDSMVAQEQRELEQCTFQPQVNNPKKDMHVAKLYLAEPAWLRLSRPRPVTPQASDASINASTPARVSSPFS